MRVVVVGAGVVGLSIAYTLAEAGIEVTVVDPSPAQGATRAAAGMLAPRSETYHREDALSRLGSAAAACYPGFVRRVEARSGRDAGLRDTQTIIVGADSADREGLTALHDLSVAHGLASERLTTREARKLEPLLGPGISCAFLAPHDHQVDPRALSAALLAALDVLGARTLARQVEAVTHDDRDDPSSAVTGVLLDGGERVDADAVVLANATGTTRVGGLPLDLSGVVRPVYGDVLRLAPPPSLTGAIGRTLRGQAGGHPAYVVPRADGTIVLGATMREDGRAGVSAQGVYELLRDAARLVPAIGEFEIVETIARARPSTPDNAPLLGWLGDGPGLVVASGFGRNGVLLAAAAGPIVAALLGLDTADADTGPHPWPDLAPFDPARFSESRRAPAA